MATKSEPGLLKHHPRFYDSAHLTFAVDGYLYQLPIRCLKESKYFQDMLDSEHLGGTAEGRADDNPISLSGITTFEMESFFDVLEARLFDQAVARDWKQLAAALHLTTMWEFKLVREEVIQVMSRLISEKGVEPLDRIEVGIQCRVSEWMKPAYQELCDRAEPLTTEEARRLGMDRLAAVYRVRDRRHSNDATSSGSGRCGYCGRTVYMSVNNASTITTSSMIMEEDILASVDGCD